MLDNHLRKIEAMDKFFERLEERRAMRPWYIKILDYFRYTLKHKFNLFISNYRGLVHKLLYGYDNRDSWSLSYKIAEYTLPRLKHLRQNLNGYPCEFKTLKQWERRLDKMIFAIQMCVDEEYIYDKKTDKKIIEGLELFGKHFRNLWD